jgi:hypothetical protein
MFAGRAQGDRRALGRKASMAIPSARSPTDALHSETLSGSRVHLSLAALVALLAWHCNAQGTARFGRVSELFRVSTA